jgi:hypothetical protein
VAQYPNRPYLQQLDPRIVEALDSLQAQITAMQRQVTALVAQAKAHGWNV